MIYKVGPDITFWLSVQEIVTEWSGKNVTLAASLEYLILLQFILKGFYG